MSAETAPEHRTLSGRASPRLLPILAWILLGAGMVAVAMWRELGTSPLDPMAMLGRLLGGAALLRALVMLLELRGATGRVGLVLGDDALSGDAALPRDALLDAVQTPRGLYLVHLPRGGRCVTTLPPALDARDLDALREWASAQRPPAEEPSKRPSELYVALARGEAPEGAAAFRLGRRWWKRAPIAALLFCEVFIEGVLRHPAELSLGPVLYVAATFAVLIPSAWLYRTRSALAGRRGVALALTPAELLFGRRGGVERARWSEVNAVRITSHRAWSLLEGVALFRRVVIDRDEGALVVDEAHLEVDAEALVATLDAYR